MMRGMAVCGIASAVLTAACDLGVVQLRQGPAPAEITVVSELEIDPADPSRLDVQVRAALDAGYGPDGMPRSLVGDALVVDGTPYDPAESGETSLRTWSATRSYPGPGPEGLRLSLPRPEGLGPGESLTMRIRVATTPPGVLSLGETEDLVIRTEPPSSPAQTVEWALLLTSESMPAYRLRRAGSGSWPEELRVPTGELPPEALPLRVQLRLTWSRGFTLIELTPEERYDLRLTSIMNLAWIVEGER